MSSPCLSGGGRSYGFELERVKPSPSAASTATASAASAITSSLTSSPSSTLSESSNSPLAISTRKPRTPRKRPNQTYNEAAALLSTVYPNIFSTSHHKFTAPAGALLLDQPSDLLLSPFPVFDTPGFLLHHHHQSHHRPIHKPDEPRLAHLTIPSYQSCGEVDSPMETTDSTNSMEVCEEEDDFDTGSILDEEIGEGIDSIMGNLSVASEMAASSGGGGSGGELNSWRSMGYNYGGKFQPGIRAFRNLEERNWWCFPIVDMLQISPRLSSNSNREPEKEKNSTAQNSNSNTNPKLKPEPDASEKRKKKKKKKLVEKAVVAELEEEVDEVEKNWNAAAAAQPDKQSLLLKLNYKEVLDAWSDRGSPYSDQGLGSADGKDAAARLALIDLFSEGGGIREARVLRYKEKRRTRLFSKKIRYQVRKVNADRRPRMKGRFVRRLSSSSNGQRREK